MRIFRPLRTSSVALLWGGLSLSAIGDQLYAVALAWTAVDVFGANAGYLSAVQALVALVAVLGIGRWADRWEQRRGMIGADLGRAAMLGLVVVAWLTLGRPTAAELVVAIVVLAVGQAVFQPALQVLLPSLIAAVRLLPAANALLDATDRSARLIGPGLVALLAGVVPMVHFFTVDACSFLLSACAILLIRRPRETISAAGRGSGGEREDFRRSISRGFRVMTRHPLIRVYFLSVGVTNGVWYSAFSVILPLMLVRYEAAGSSATSLGVYGLILSAYGCANLASTLVFGSRAMPPRPQFQMAAGQFLLGAGIAFLGLSSFLPVDLRVPGYVFAAALGAIGGPMKDIPMAVLRQTRLSPGDVGAGMRAYMAMGSAGALVAMLATPSLIGVAGSVGLMVAFGAVYVMVGIVALVTLAKWHEPDRAWSG